MIEANGCIVEDFDGGVHDPILYFNWIIFKRRGGRYENMAVLQTL